MRCEDAEVQIESHAAGEQTGPEAAALEAHLAACVGCREGAERARRLLAILARERAPDLPDGFFERQRAAIMGRLGPELEWEAPRLSLVTLFAVLGGYLAGVMPPFMDTFCAATGGLAAAWANLADVAGLYLMLVLGAVATFRRDPAPVFAEVRS